MAEGRKKEKRQRGRTRRRKLLKPDLDSRRKVQVEMSPPQLPKKTVVPMAEERAVSDVTLAADQAVQSAPKEKAPIATIKAAA